MGRRSISLRESPTRLGFLTNLTDGMPGIAWLVIWLAVSRHELELTGAFRGTIIDDFNGVLAMD